MNIEEILNKNAEWVRKKLTIDHSYFDELSKPQSPQTLYIGCADSRVTAEEIMGVGPGEVFVHRNIANLVVNTDISMMSTINFAVEHLKVKDIIICGHYHCGGIRAAMQSKDYGILNPWLRSIRDVYRMHKHELDLIQCDHDKSNRLAELNVIEQCTNVLKTPEVQRAVSADRLNIYGWMFNIGTGKLIDLKVDYKQILESIMEVYRII